MVKLGKAKRWHGIDKNNNGKEVGMKKKILIAVLVVALAITSVVALVACDNGLDGEYYYSQNGIVFKITIEGNYLKMTEGYSREEQTSVRNEGEFERDGDILTVNKGKSSEFTVKIDGKNLIYREIFDCTFVKAK